MFGVAWTEPVKTVGQRKAGKDKEANRLSQGSSIISSKSSESPTSPSQSRPSLFSIFGYKKGALQQSGLDSKLGTVRSESTLKISNRLSTYTIASDCANQELSVAKAVVKIPLNSCSEDGRQSNADTEASCRSDGMSAAAPRVQWAKGIRIGILGMECEVIHSDRVFLGLELHQTEGRQVAATESQFLYYSKHGSHRISTK